MRTVFVTGGTGLSGANVCQQLIARGDTVQALGRNPAEAAVLADLGVKRVQGDIANPDDVIRASKGCDAAIHCAALLGGASQNLEDFHAVNCVGTTNVHDAALGENIVTCHPGAIYGPGLVTARALHPTNFNRMLLAIAEAAAKEVKPSRSSDNPTNR